jgi:enamine deaminase RidA (YjgF/YER057c/UK114 family)
MHFGHVVRTWFYNDRILDWYDAFNHVRTEFFRRHGITRMPASTGVGAANPSGSALVAKALAVLPKSDAATIRPVESPLQCDAFAYGSAFSRAMEVATTVARTIYVSGTASIAPGGKTIYAGSTLRQIDTTMEVVDALLANAGMTLADTTRAIAYFRHAADMHLWDEYRRARRLPEIPVIVTQCDICRDDLLFEIELDAARPRSVSTAPA